MSPSDRQIFDLLIISFYGIDVVDEYIYNLFKNSKSFEALEKCFPENEKCIIDSGGMTWNYIAEIE